jgi:hypothetical protein
MGLEPLSISNNRTYDEVTTDDNTVEGGESEFEDEHSEHDKGGTELELLLRWMPDKSRELG